MLDINSKGDVAHGIGGGQASINNTPYAKGGNGGWITDTVVGFSSGEDVFDGDNWAASSYDWMTGKKSRLDDPPTGASRMYCGGGHAAWWWAGRGLFSTIPAKDPETGEMKPLRLPKAGLLAMGKDAAICYKPDYYSNGPTMVRELDGTEWLLTNGAPALPDDLHLLGSRKAVYCERGKILAVGLDQPLHTSDGPVYGPRAAFVGNEWWISYYSDLHGLVLHPFNSFQGFPLLAPGIDGWHNIRAIAPNVVRVWISRGIAEAPGQLFYRDFNVATNEVWGTDLVRSPVTRVDVRTITLPVKVPPINRALWFGWFEYTPDPTLPANCRLKVIKDAEIDYLYDMNDKLLAQYVAAEKAGNTPTAMEAAIAAARAKNPGVPVIAYFWPGAQGSYLPSADFIGVNAYRLVNEPVDVFENRMRAALAQCPQAVLIPQCYTSNAGLTTDLVSIVPVAARLARDYTNVKAVLIFSGSGRATGLQDHPEVRPLWETLFQSVSTPKELLVTPPKITITSYSPRSGVVPLRVRAVYAQEPDSGPISQLAWLYRRDGQGEWKLAALNPADDPDHTYVFKEPGFWEIKLRASGPGGEWETGAHRVVEAQPTPSPAPQPTPEPQPTPTPVPTPTPSPAPAEGREIVLGLQAQKGQWVCADRGLSQTRLVANRGRMDEYETFTWTVQSDNTFTWKSSNGKYVRALNGHLYADSLTPVTFTFELLDDGKIAIKGPDGKYLSADAGGGGELWINRTAVFDWEKFTPSASLAVGPTAGTRRQPKGAIRLNRHVFADDNGDQFLIGTSFFWEWWGWKHERDRTIQNLDFITPYVDYVRAFGMVGSASWSDRVIDPYDPEYWTVMEEIFDANDLRGIRTLMTIFADAQVMMPNTSEREAFVDRWAEFSHGREHQFFIFEIANEFWQNGFSDDAVEVKRLADRLRARTSVPVAVSSPSASGDTEEEYNETYSRPYRGCTANVATVHFGRDYKADGPYRAIRQPWEYQFVPNLPDPYVNNEPIGPQSSVAADDDPARMALGALVTGLARGGAYCLHTGAGIRGGGAADLARGRSSNIYDVPRIREIFAALMAVRTLIPDDIANWSPRNWADKWNPPLRFIGSSDDYDRQIVRSFAAVSGNRFIWAPMGVQFRGGSSPRFIAQFDMDLTYHDPATAEVLQQQHVNAGEIVTITRDYIIRNFS